MTPVGRSRPRTSGLPGVNRRDPACAAMLAEWRALTTPAGRTRRGGGALTVLACSGGADSSGLALALAAGGDAARRQLIVAHVVHDARPAAEALADRDAVRALAGELGLPFAEGQARARGVKGNQEAALRRARYAALLDIARAHGAGFVATAHHAHDQLETVMMALLRGSGPAGLRGVAHARPLSSDGRTSGPASVTLIRPALGVSPDDLRQLCRQAGFVWREDATNADVSRLRSRLRRQVLPGLLAWRPDAAARAARLARVFTSIHELLESACDRRWAQRINLAGRSGRPGLGWRLSDLRDEQEAVLARLLQRAHSDVTGGRWAGRLSSDHLWAVVDRLKRPANASGQFTWPGVRVSLAKGELAVRPAPSRERA